MTYELLPPARRELRHYIFHVAADDPYAAVREELRIRAALGLAVLRFENTRSYSTRRTAVRSDT